MKNLRRVSNAVNNVVSYTGMILFVILIFACVAQVFFRFVLNNSLSWTEELARYCFIWMHMIAPFRLGAFLQLPKQSEHSNVGSDVDDQLFGGRRRTVAGISGFGQDRCGPCRRTNARGR